ncbi:cadherin-5-like isoform X2 [Sinocyclocheilus grahami]|uniref:cadherin-5-like isoform X2 n=1 Tax=Sinocyclocheilus grahami TaxID=75366 RepID=UPI0007AC93FE|nr:PREDICTED: cadherin-5-like isoform X2 [Sinocyclocheilus grahami]
MMKQTARRQMAEPGFWAGVLVILCTLSMGADVHQALKTPSMPSRVLQRHKRAWKWDKLYVNEEMPPKNPPEKIGKLENTFFNASARYILSGEGANDIFTVNDNGDIIVNAKLDREKKNVYNLSASLINITTTKQIDHDDTFIIVVMDINDNSPVFPPDVSGSISESSKAGSIVMTVKATDADDPTTQNGMIGYKLLNGTDLFAINNKGEIRTLTSSLDREKRSQYLIAIQAKDMPDVSNTGNSATTIVTININDVNDNIATFKTGEYQFNVKEDSKPGYEIGKLKVEDKDEIQNKDPSFTIQHKFDEVFGIKLSNVKDGILSLKVPLDYETQKMHKFSVNVLERTVSKSPDNQGPKLQTRAQVFINVIDVDEPPVFNQTEYKFSFYEGPFQNPIIGAVSAKDPDKNGYKIRYSIEDSNCPVAVDPVQGYLSLKKQLDREDKSSYTFQVTAQENVTNGLKSYALVNLKVLDINDNAPELTNRSYVYVCESDKPGTIIGTVGAYDKDENSGRFRFTLAKRNLNFSLYDNGDNTARIELKQGGFSTEHSVEHVLEIEITDGGTPEQKSINLLQIKVCTCQTGRRVEYCMAYTRTGMSVSALLAILLCIVTILVIVILIVLRRRYQKEILVTKSSGEIHEQLVSYDEEGGGEMDTNGYDVSILSSACHDSSFRPSTGPSLYAVVKKPSACKGDMAMMIEVKKDEADHDRDGIPYDTLHIYGCEGSESLSGSLSSLDSSSSGSNLDYDFLHEWGPRFRTLAQLYGVDGSDSDSSD